MEIEDYLRGFRLGSPAARLRRRVLAAARPWRPWYLAAAAAAILACAALNAWSTARLERTLGGPAAETPAVSAGSPGRLVAGARADSLLAIKRELERDWP